MVRKKKLMDAEREAASSGVPQQADKKPVVGDARLRGAQGGVTWERDEKRKGGNSDSDDPLLRDAQGAGLPQRTGSQASADRMPDLRLRGATR